MCKTVDDTPIYVIVILFITCHQKLYRLKCLHSVNPENNPGMNCLRARSSSPCEGKLGGHLDSAFRCVTHLSGDCLGLEDLVSGSGSETVFGPLQFVLCPLLSEYPSAAFIISVCLDLNKSTVNIFFLY